MNEVVIETVIMAFTIGGIIGAAAAFSLRSSHLWDSSEHQLNLKAIPIKRTRQRR